jgi:methyl-accepting chemotaxis protein WspA
MFFTTRTIARRVRGAAEVADRIAHGDLTEPIEESRSGDETGELVRSMRTMDGNLNALVGSVKQAGIRLNSTATEIAATSKQQEQSASTFGAASNQIAAAVKEISATGQDLVRTMENVNAMAPRPRPWPARAQRTARHGVGDARPRSRHHLDRREAGGNQRSLAAHHHRDHDDHEGRRSDEHPLDQRARSRRKRRARYGAGFLVIAREIRRLADQTASATLDIEQMVQQMQAAVSAGVMEMDRFSDQVRRGVRDVASAGTQLTEIIERVNRSTDSFKQVNESMQAQSEGAQQISDAMASLVVNANQTMQSVNEFGRAATDLQSAIALLRQAVAQFKLKE